MTSKQSNTHAGFNINEHLPHLPVQADTYTEVDGEVITDHYKRLHIGEHLSVYIDAESGQAILEHYGSGDNTFYWDDNIERILADPTSVNLAELFTEMYNGRWE